MLAKGAFLVLITAAAAEYANNINYRSPSLTHNLAVSLHKVLKRQVGVSSLPPERVRFTHGVASGDPYADSIILWTRASPIMDSDESNVTVSGTADLYNHETEQYVAASKSPICVDWTISTDQTLQHAAAGGRAFTSSDIDYTVKVEATGLQPYTTYWYQFNICGSDVQSPLGRTKTAPRADQDVDNIGVAVFSCANFPLGYFNAYGNSARKDNVDYVIMLGDYIYEYKTSSPAYGRAVNPERELFTLYDYRARIGTYRTDKDLLLSHQRFPWIATWDDHEVANNEFRDGSARLNNTEESFEEHGRVSVDQRKMNAVRAYFEWQPIRQVDMDNNLRVWRSFSIGNLFDLIILDTRNYDRSITDLDWNTDYIEQIINDAGRTMMGSIQENWFYKTLKRSKATWRIIGSQVLFSTIHATKWVGNEFNYDAWDGYMANKNRTLKTMYDNKIGNNIMLAGDTHKNWVSDLVWLGEQPYDPDSGSGALGVEFAGTAVSSSSSCGDEFSFESCNQQSRNLIEDNPELQWQEGYYRGYFEMQISKQKVTAQYFGMPTVTRRNGWEVSLANFTVENGANRLRRPVSDGSVRNGALRNTETKLSNLTHDTNRGEWFIHHEDVLNIPVPET